jgi:uncharacterized membrane protein YhaH (DUF805 family)
MTDIPNLDNEKWTSPTNFVGKTAGRLYWQGGLAIITIILTVTNFQMTVLSDNTVSSLCYYLEFVWPGISRTYSQMLELDHRVEANSYVLLVLITFIYAAGVFVAVIIKYCRVREKVPNVTMERDAAPSVILGVLFLAAPRMINASRV